MLSYLAFVMRHTPEQSDNYGDRLILHALRLQQDCPANGILLRKVPVALSGISYYLSFDLFCRSLLSSSVI